MSMVLTHAEHTAEIRTFSSNESMFTTMKLLVRISAN